MTCRPRNARRPRRRRRCESERRINGGIEQAGGIDRVIGRVCIGEANTVDTRRRVGGGAAVP